jgi:hypothetical protein
VRIVARVDIRARVSGHRLNADAHDVSAVLYLGQEPEGSGIDFGPALVTGRRLL